MIMITIMTICELCDHVCCDYARELQDYVPVASVLCVDIICHGSYTFFSIKIPGSKPSTKRFIILGLILVLKAC